MKQVIKCLFVLMLMMSLCSCKKEEEPVIKETTVSIKDFMDKVNLGLPSDSGSQYIYECPCQNGDYDLVFYYENDRPLVSMINNGVINNAYTEVKAEIASVTLNEDTKIYTLNLVDYDSPLKYNTLHIDFSNFDKDKVINAENIFDENKLVEYMAVLYEPLPFISFEGEKITYYNQSNDSFFILYGDKTFEFTEIMGMGADLLTGTWLESDGILHLDCESSTIYVGDSLVTKIDFNIEDSDTLILQNELLSSKPDDVFKTEVPILEGPMGAPDLPYSFYRANIADVSFDYMPTIEFDSAGMFTFTENVYYGMFTITGGWSFTDIGYECIVDINNIDSNTAGCDVKKIYFDKVDDKTIVLKTDICMSTSGEKFYLVP